MELHQRLLRVQKQEPSNTQSNVRYTTHNNVKPTPSYGFKRPSVPRPSSSKLPVNHNGCPWRKSNFYYGRGILGLHQEIQHFYSYMMATPLEHTSRLQAISRIETLVVNLFPHASVEVYGSFSSSLYLPTSDIDLVIIGQWQHLPLRMIENHLLMYRIADPLTIKVLDKAAVPIIKLTDIRTKIKIDISFNMKSGVKTAELIRKYKTEYPVMSKLVMVLKQFLVQHEMNEVFTGGISSYSLILMCISFLQLHPRQNFKNVNLGVLLLEFLEFYGRKFNYMTTGISIKNGGKLVPKVVLQKDMKVDFLHPSILCIEDPLTPGNDVGKASHGALQVKQLFENAYITLVQAVAPRNFKLNDCNSKSILGSIVRISDDVIEFRKALRGKIVERMKRESAMGIKKFSQNQNQTSSSSDDIDGNKNSNLTNKA